jgi:hypothetical protein
MSFSKCTKQNLNKDTVWADFSTNYIDILEQRGLALEHVEIGDI